jgi:hypothetical protein
MTRAFLLAAILAPLVCHGQLVVGVEAPRAGARDRILSAAKSLVGTTEATGNNDGAAIDRILASVGLEGTGAPYCAAYNRWVYDAADLRAFGPRSALAASWVQAATWTRAGGGRTPLSGDTWGIYFPSKKRVAHTGIVWVWGSTTVRTLEANTSPEAVAGSAADRNGDGVWSKYRLKNQIYASRNWLGD